MSIKKVYFRICFKKPILDSFIYSYQTSQLLLDKGENHFLYRRVQCPFGKNNRLEIGFVIDVCQKSDLLEIDFSLIKSIQSFLDEHPILNKQSVKIATWISNYYFSSLGECLSLFIPFSNIQPNKKLLKKYQNKSEKKAATKNISLNKEQQDIYEAILNSNNNISLLYGLTGSGKTFIYLKLIQKKIAEKKQVLYLVPEIGLIFQVQNLLSTYFDKKDIAVIHNKITSDKKLAIRELFYKNKISILIGTRSTLFVPTSQLGVIIIDEEHDSSYKNSQTPRYKTNQVAQMMVKNQKELKLILGSATPSLESFYQTKKKNINFFSLMNRYYGNPSLSIEFIEQRKDDHYVLSDKIIDSMQTLIDNKKQGMMFLNRRGFSHMLQCADCGWIQKCPFCDISMTYHKKKNKLLCHYCDFSKKFNINQSCPNCGLHHLEYLGIGIERIEDEVLIRLPYLKIIRMDSDLTSTPKKINETLNAFREKKYHLLIGTQIISKGHDFANVSNVYIINPENALNLPDFRAVERTYGQISQLIGRASRRNQHGNVFIQTITPHHYVIELGANQEYNLFFSKEIKYRQTFFYPPFCKIFRIVFRGKNEEKVIIASENSFKWFTSNKIQDYSKILGPSPCFLNKIRLNYRWNILFKVENYQFFQKIILIYKKMYYPRMGNIYIEFDMDPTDLL